MRVFLCSVVAAAVSFLSAPATSPQAPARDVAIRVEHIPDQVILSRAVKGDYAQHAQLLADLAGYVARSYAGFTLRPGDVFGIYPVDPDAVDAPDMLTWEVGVVLASAGEPAGPSSGLRPPAAPYEMKTLAGSDAIVLESDIGHAGLDGLTMSRWMLEHGYVQIAPTRMQYLSTDSDPLKIRTRIVIPARLRRSGLRLAGR
jgi:hypothetical protein